MIKESRLTNNTHESSLGEILRGRSYFVIPPFQREYKWKKSIIEQLDADIRRLKDGEEEAHFLGAFIIDALPNDPDAPTNYEVIDGQQRLTTFYLLVASVVRVLLQAGEIELASQYALDYLFTREAVTKLKTSLIPSIPDRNELNGVTKELWDCGLNEGLAAFKFEPLSAGPSRSGLIRKNFELLRRIASKIHSEEGVEGVKEYLTAAQSGLTVVQILVKDPTSGPKIFDSLNSKQEPMTTGDLVRNDIFGKVARVDPTRAQELDAELWQPFYSSFFRDNVQHFEGFFFPFGLIKDPSFKKGEVFNGLRKDWSDLSPDEVMRELDAYRLEYQDLVFGENKCLLPLPLADQVLRLHRMNFPKVALPFLMQSIHAYRTEEINADACLSMLGAVESFLVRRALCHHAPTGLHSVFKKLWDGLDCDYSAAKVKSVIADAATVTIPSDDDVENSFKNPLYGKGIAKYFLFEFDRDLGGDPGSFDNLWIEHVLPQKQPESNWSQFSSDEHSKLKDLAGNLIPLSQHMNIDVGQDSIEEKASTYRNDSGFKSARSFGAEFQSWGPDDLVVRTTMLAKWAIQRWPY